MHSVEKIRPILSDRVETEEPVQVFTRSKRDALRLVREASTLFRDAWMPLEVCLSLRAQTTTECEGEDPLATLFQRVRGTVGRFRNTNCSNYSRLNP